MKEGVIKIKKIAAILLILIGLMSCQNRASQYNPSKSLPSPKTEKNTVSSNTKELIKHLEKVKELLQKSEKNDSLIIHYINKSLAIDSTIDFLYNFRGIHRAHLQPINNRENALRCVADFSKAIALNDTDYRYYYNKAESYHNIREYKKSLEILLQAKKIAPNEIHIHHKILSNAFNTRQYEKASRMANEIINRFPEKCGYAYYIRGQLKRDYLHKYVEGNKDIKKANEMDWWIPSSISDRAKLKAYLCYLKTK